MIIENSPVRGIRSDLYHMDKATEKLGFVRWQWEYNRATYDLKYESNGSDYYLRINARAIEGKLENPDAILELHDAYLGKSTFPHGLDYTAPIPDAFVKISDRKLAELKQLLS